MKDFVSYNEALKLKELGFNEPCIFGYNDYHVLRSKIASSFDGDFVKWNAPADAIIKYNNLTSGAIFLPLPLYFS